MYVIRRVILGGNLTPFIANTLKEMFVIFDAIHNNALRRQKVSIVKLAECLITYLTFKKNYFT